MPVGYYGTVKIAGKRYEVQYFNTMKSECKEWEKVLKREGYMTKIIKHPIKLGNLAGGLTVIHWAIAVRKKDWK